MSNELYGAYLGAHVHGAHTRFSAFTSARECALRALRRARQRARPDRATRHRETASSSSSSRVQGTARCTSSCSTGASFRTRTRAFCRTACTGRRWWSSRATSSSTGQPCGRAAQGTRHLRAARRHVHRGGHLPAAPSSACPTLVDLGVTTLELMPVAAFAGTRGWGYDGVAHFAPHAPYGTPDELRALVDAAHGLGSEVLLDVVYNHFGPAGNYLSCYQPGLLHARGARMPGATCPTSQHPAMRAFASTTRATGSRSFASTVCASTRVHAIVDPSPRHVLSRAGRSGARARARPHPDRRGRSQRPAW